MTSQSRDTGLTFGIPDPSCPDDMNARMADGIVNSWNEWDPLEEVIVGSARGAADIGYEPALEAYDIERDYRGGRIAEAVVDEAERQLDGLAETLQRLGIEVRRPDPADYAVPVKTPDWEVAFSRASACPRDVLLVIGDEIIEAPMTQRARFFEYRAYRRLAIDYFRRGARWTSAPKPFMTEALYDVNPDRRPFDYADGPLLSEIEPAFDAASFARFGRDIFWQPDLVSNHLGAEWLRRHLGSRFRVHEIRFAEALPAHVDTTLVPIRPGTVLVNPERPNIDGWIDRFARNGWRVVAAPPSVRSGRSPARDVSNWISMNILMLDEKTAVVEQGEEPMIELLRSLGCDVLAVPFDRVYAFGGGIHCCTADIRRQGTLRSYFPEIG